VAKAGWRDAIGVMHGRSPDARIASLVPSLTETLFEFGLGDRVVARTGFCIHPEPAVRTVPKVGGTKDVRLDRLLATQPTHVLMNIDESRRELFEQLRGRVPHVIVTHPQAPEDNIALYELLGGVFGAEHAASAMSRALSEALGRARSLRAQARDLTVLYLIWRHPWMTVARTTYASAMLNRAGFRTLPEAASVRYPEVSADAGEWERAEVVFLSSEPYSFTEDDARQLAGRLPGGQPVRLIDGEMVTWFGSRAPRAIDYLIDLRRRMEDAVTEARV
jgi:ABC-type Fe3+-hydroxamate transport system substrate-binding protein